MLLPFPTVDRHTTDHYDALYRAFRWQVPANFQLAQACCGRWARHTPDAPAVLYEHEDGERSMLSYAELQREANRLSNTLRRLGVARGARVAIVMPQRPQTVIAHIAVQQIGAVAVPLSMLFGPEALTYRLNNSAVKLAIVDDSAIANLLVARPTCPGLKTVLTVGAAQGQGDVDWTTALAGSSDRFTSVKTTSDDAAVLIYTSGTTGPPKGALIPQRALIGNLSGFVCSQNWFPQADAVFWSPADWAWTGGLMDALLPTLYFGRPIVAYHGRFSAERAFALMQRHGVTHTFLFPTALKAMLKAVPAPREHYTLQLRATMSAGEPVGGAVFDYCEQQLGVTVNEMFGQTEINYVVGNCALHWPARAGSMGRPYPGHRVAVIDDAGHECPRGTVGDVAVHRRDIHGHPDPVFFLGYWKNDAATRRKFTAEPDNSWCRTGDMARMDDDGYLWYLGRTDDVFKAAGYRIGPSEIENCLVMHPAVANAVVVPKPDAERGAVVKAYVVLAPGAAGTPQLVEELQHHVRGKLAPYEYPKEIEFIDALPMTPTGKVQRGLLRQQEQERAHLKLE